jgi:hypothetical protein
MYFVCVCVCVCVCLFHISVADINKTIWVFSVMMALRYNLQLRSSPFIQPSFPDDLISEDVNNRVLLGLPW